MLSEYLMMEGREGGREGEREETSGAGKMRAISKASRRNLAPGSEGQPDSLTPWPCRACRLEHGP